MTAGYLRELEELYHAACENPGVLAAAKPELRLEVESLLALEGSELPPLSLGKDELWDQFSPLVMAPGTQLGIYVIEAQVGAGGMGVVFRASDTQLRRPVAVKVLSDELADVSARLRFQREAQLASSLNHPHIVTVHAAGEFERRQYLVTEFVDGGTLADWAHAEKRKWPEIVELLTGVADGLAAAHEAGILHRDIKPTNILLAKSGYAKLADFGLAKLADSTHSNPAIAQNESGTPLGHIFGTVPYLCPEGAQGRLVDARSDIFSFGVVLYEMLCGQRPFNADSDIELLGKIVSSAPAALPEHLPIGLRMIVEKALEKEPGDRYQSARDLVVDLRREVRRKSDSLRHGHEDATQRTPGRATRSRPFWLYIALAATLASTATFLLMERRHSSASPVAALNASLLPPPGTSFVFARNGDGGFAISPDGAMLAFVGRSQGKAQLWVRRLGVAESRLVLGSEGAYRPFWSPDSRWVAFFTPLKLKKNEVESGKTLELCDVGNLSSGAWNARNVILWSRGRTRPIQRIPDVGGTPEPVPGTTGGADPSFLPDGEHFVYRGSFAGSDLWLASLNPAEKPRRMGETGTRPTWSAGHLLSVSNGILTARPFDPERREFTGESRPLNAVAVRVHMGLLISDFSANAAGMLVYPPRTDSLTELRWRDRAGKLLGTIGAPGEYYTPRISPDGQRVAFSRRDGNTSDIWVANPIANSLSRLTFDPGIHDHPVWSPDGTTIAYSDNASGTENVYRKAALGIGTTARLTTSTFQQQTLDWSRDNRFLLFTQISLSTEIMVQPVDGGPPLSFLGHGGGAAKPQFNPGVPRWIAYDFDDSGRREIYVQAFIPGRPASSARWQVSDAGGTSPRWRADGKEIFYLSLDGKLMAARVSGEGPSFQSSIPELLFNATAPMMRSPSFEYDVSPDGKRFLLIEPAEKAEYLPLTIVGNWAAR